MPGQNLETQVTKLKSRRRERAPMNLAHEDDKTRTAITIEDKSTDEIYLFWRDFGNLPFFMKDLSEVRTLSKKKSHWIIKLKSGVKVEWDAEITEEHPGVMLAWKSMPGSQVTTSGSVWFTKASDSRGTVVTLSMDYSIPGGKATELVTMLRGEDPDSLARTNLRRLKAYLETGEIPTVEGQSSGREEAKRSRTKH